MPTQPRNPLQRWLKRYPQPTMLRCYSPDGGEERTIKIGLTSSRWRDATESCERFERIEALDDAGNILREYKNEIEETVEEKAAKVAFDPETHRLEHFAS